MIKTADTSLTKLKTRNKTGSNNPKQKRKYKTKQNKTSNGQIKHH